MCLWDLKDLPAPTIEEDRRHYTPAQLRAQDVTRQTSERLLVAFLFAVGFVIGSVVLASCNREAMETETGRVVVRVEVRK